MCLYCFKNFDFNYFLRIGSRPLDLDDKPDRMWIKTKPETTSGKYTGTRETVDAAGDIVSTAVPAISLPALLTEEERVLASFDDAHSKTKRYSMLTADELDGNIYHR